MLRMYHILYILKTAPSEIRPFNYVFPTLASSIIVEVVSFVTRTFWQPMNHGTNLLAACRCSVAAQNCWRKNKGISELNTTCNKGLAFPEEYSRCTGVSNPFWKGVFYLRVQTVLSLGSTWNPSKHVQFRPPGKFEQLCMQSLKSTHSLISEKQIIQHKLLVIITAIWQTFVSRNILAESYININ